MQRPKPRRLSERARLLIEQAEALGEPPEDPLLLFSVLYGYWAASYVAFDGNLMRKLAAGVSSARRGSKGNSPAHGGASHYGSFSDC